MNYIKNILKAIAFLWLTTFDKSCFIYKSLKTMHISYRFVFYSALSLSLYFTLEYLVSFISFADYNFPYFITRLALAIMSFIKFLSILFTIGIFAYEFIYDVDIDKYLHEQKEKEDLIKKNKKQFWRLRNMNILLRTLIYLGGWSFMYLTAETLLVSSFSALFPNPTKEDYLVFVYEYDLTIKILTIGYFAIALVVDYYVRKQIKKG